MAAARQVAEGKSRQKRMERDESALRLKEVSHEPDGEKSPGDRRDARDRAGGVEAFLAAGARVAVNGSSAASVAAALEGLKDRERAVAAAISARSRAAGASSRGRRDGRPAGRPYKQRRRRRAAEADRRDHRGRVGRSP